jgi:hypothetical protein
LLSKWKFPQIHFGEKRWLESIIRENYLPAVKARGYLDINHLCNRKLLKIEATQIVIRFKSGAANDAHVGDCAYSSGPFLAKETNDL